MSSNVSSEGNIIKVAFGRDDHEVMHPASKNFAPAIDEDPLAELMKELGEDGDLGQSLSSEFEQSSFARTPQEMAGAIIEQLRELRESSSKLKYYLDELNLSR